MQITHDEARKLIQFSADQALQPQEKNTLQLHLKDCDECRSFANDIREVEILLIPVMKRQWSLQPSPLPIELLTEKRNIKWRTNILLTTRTALISLVFFAFV